MIAAYNLRTAAAAARLVMEIVEVGSLIRIDPELCIGSAECVRLAPALFRVDEGRGVSEPLPAAGSADPALLAQAAAACPMQAITVEGTDR